MNFRIGNGYDVHRLVQGRKLIIGGVEVPFEKGLLGHSDADVLIHAIMDAMLGAAALGDIGGIFPDTSEEFKDADSMVLLRNVVKILNNNNYKVGNIDSIIVAQMPKMKPFIEQMRKNIADACDLNIDQINIKATTEEKLGFTGAGDGISSYAVTLIEKIH